MSSTGVAGSVGVVLQAAASVTQVLSPVPRQVLLIWSRTSESVESSTVGLVASAHITLVHPSAPVLAHARDLLGDHAVTPVQADFVPPGPLTDILPVNHFDLVLCPFALHHQTDDEKRRSIEEIARCLQPEGLLILAEQVAFDKPGGWDALTAVRNLSSSGAYTRARQSWGHRWRESTTSPAGWRAQASRSPARWFTLAWPCCWASKR